MAGHSKWANIRHRKNAQDSKRGKLFTRLIRELTVAARKGALPAENPSLRQSLERALMANVPRETINRAIARGSGAQSGGNLEQEARYEGYGPCGVAILVDVLTDNRNRTVAEVRSAFSKAGGKLGTDGSVAYLFKRCGDIAFPADVDVDALMEIAAKLDVEDVLEEDAELRVVVSPDIFVSAIDAFTATGLSPTRSEILMLPTSTINIERVDGLAQLMRLLNVLDDIDDVSRVSHNADFSEELWHAYTASEKIY